MSSSPRTIWRRRAILMAVVALAVAVPVTLLLAEDEGEERSPVAPIQAEPEPVELGKSRTSDAIGVSYRLPTGWKRKRQGPVLVLRSADRQARVAISSPGPAAEADRIRQEIVRGLRGSYKEFEIVTRDSKAKLGGRPAASLAIRARSAGRRNRELGILLTVVKAKKRTYVTAVYTPAVDPGAAALEAQALLGEIGFVR